VSACTTFTYDADNEPLTVTYSDGTTPNVSGVSYDADGHRTAMTDGTGNTSWTYDSLGRLTSSTNGNSAEVQWSYDLRNLPTTITYPGSHAVTDGYDDAGRMTSVEDWLGTPNTTTFGYDADSNLTTETFPSGSGLVDTFGFNAADQMSSVSDVTGGTTLFSATYTRDANGQLASDTSVPSASASFHYTPLNQLCYAGSSSSSACASPPSGSTAYGFDAADNLTTNNGTTQAFNAADELCWTLSGTSSNSCSSAPTGATTYAYDTRGNQTGHVPATGSATCDAYDQADRLTSISTGTGSGCTSPSTVGTYAYNGDGLRMKKVVGSTTTQFTWDASGSIPLVVQETAGSTTTSYLYGPGGLPVEQVSPSGTALFYSHDQLGSTRLVTDGAGTTQATYTYDPYGNLTSSTNPGSITNPLRYGGQYTDAESGLIYLRARYYDPGTGQFLTRDPAVAVTGAPYGYVGDSPLNGADPSGLDFLPGAGGGGQAAPNEPYCQLDYASETTANLNALLARSSGAASLTTPDPLISYFSDLSAESGRVIVVAAAGGVVCEVFGLGPEDPAADACATPFALVAFGAYAVNASAAAGELAAGITTGNTTAIKEGAINLTVDVTFVPYVLGSAKASAQFIAGVGREAISEVTHWALK
jgi:RHS repeat-associated protein